jgi:pyruvate/2-oxoglutarate dehydrogenase complex dihydrolipoamide acyltransferase (E2) component
VAKKTDKAVKELAKEVKKLRKQNERLAASLEKAREDQTAAHHEILDLLEKRLAARDAASDGPSSEDQEPDAISGETAEEDRVRDGEVPEDRTPDAGDDGEPEITEAAQRRARELGVDLSNVEGTGSGGRILVKDVEAAADGGQ